MNSPPFWRRHEFSLLLSVMAVAVITAVLDVQHNYWHNPRDTAIDLTRQWSMLGLYSLGAAVVIIAGGIDLSAGSVIAFSGTICATLLLVLAPEAMTRSEPLPQWVIATAIAGTMLSGFLIGSLHAWLITVVGLPPFVATLATLVGLRSLARAICESATLAVIGGSSTQIGLFDRNFRYLATSVWIPAVVLIVLSLAMWLVLSRTVLGRHLYALGGNEQAARLSGIQTDRLKWVAYCVSAMLSSLAGILYICEQSVADPQTLGRGYELNAIAAAVVGGCSLQGGVGTVPGTLLGALFLRTVIDGVSKIIKTGADVYEGLIVGVVVVFAVVFTRGPEATQRQRSLFAGALGLVTVVNLTLLAGVLMALIGSRLLGSLVQMNALWLAGFSMVAVFALLCLLRQPWSPATQKRLGLVWAALTIATGIGVDRYYPIAQTNAAVSAVKQLGGKVVSNDAGIVVDLNDTAVDDAAFRRLEPRLAALHPLVELRLRATKLTDKSVDGIGKLKKSLKTIDIRGSGFTPGGAMRLRRAAPDALVVTEP
ncbi:MAG: ABC transporter permease [Planctomycetaceae bacterium]|nr:ABC transporter permease [Planctomycetaceae bacterium]